MRGNRARLNANNGEVVERFWAQAAADQAAGRQADDGEEGMFTGGISSIILLTNILQVRPKERFPLTHNSSMTSTTMARALMISTTVTQEARAWVLIQNLGSVTSLPKHRVHLDASVRKLSIMHVVPSEWMFVS